MGDVPTAFVIDHDAAEREAVAGLLRSVEIAVETFGSAHVFLEVVDPSRPGCLVLDARLPGMSGLELQHRLAEWEVSWPMVIVTAHGDIPMAVEAMRAGAVDFLEKPFRPQRLLDRVHEALGRDAAARDLRARHIALETRAGLLTRREREVMEHIVHGLSNRTVAAQLGVTRKAVEAYRARVMQKMQATSLAELVRMSVVLEHGCDRGASFGGRAAARQEPRPPA